MSKSDDIALQLALLKAKDGAARSGLMNRGPKQLTTKQQEALRALKAAGGSLPAEDIHHKLGKTLGQRGWAELKFADGELRYLITPEGEAQIHNA